jgi:acetyltransferase-like isoleucine patch superfamily enzyme
MAVPRGEQYRSTGVKLGTGCRIWGKIDLHYPSAITIGNNVVLGGQSFIISHCPIRGTDHESMKITIEDNAWIGYGCIILPGTHIQKRTIIGAGSVVSGECLSVSVYAGNPCKFIRKRNRDEIIRTFLLIKQGFVVSIPSINPTRKITKEEITELFQK